MDKYLILKGCAGLGNRLITLSNAINYAQITNRTLVVDWSDGQFGVKGENAFNKYFTLNNISHIKDLNALKEITAANSFPPIWGENPKSSLYDLYIQERSSFLTRLHRFIKKGQLSKLTDSYWKLKGSNINITANQSDFRALKSAFNINDLPFGGNYKKDIKKTYVFYADFCPEVYSKYLIDNLQLEKNIEAEINSFACQKQLAKNTIGIHIRMTDKKPENELSQLIKKINDFNLINPHIFLATDNESVIYELSKHFNIIVTYPKTKLNLPSGIGIHQYATKTGDYDLVNNIFKESIMDVWLLSKCEYLIYQSNSTFSFISSILKTTDKDKITSW